MIARAYTELLEEAAAIAPLREHGRSVRGEPLWHLELTPAAAAGAPWPCILVIAGLHAMEHVGPISALALARRAAAQQRGEAPGPWARRRLVVAPLANPDGFREVEAGRAAGVRRRFWRKNARGVDLNRNFAEGWDASHYLNRLAPRFFAPGEAPLSEPESVALDALATRVRPAAVVSLHAFGEWLYLPWAGRRERPPQWERMEAIARAMVAAQPRPYRLVQLGRRSRLFLARGAEIDHFLARHGALSFLFEIGGGPRLAEPGGWFDPYRWFTASTPELLARDVDNLLPALDALAEAELTGPA